MVGDGCVGLSAAACLAEIGHDVVGTDNNAARIDSLANRTVHIHEPNLPELVSCGLRSRKLKFGSCSSSVVTSAQFVILCLPTPTTDNGSADISALTNYVTSHSRKFSTDSIRVTKSAVPVGTTRKLAALVAQPEVRLASNPEFVREGSTVADLMRPDRNLIGSDSEEVGAAVGRSTPWLILRL